MLLFYLMGQVHLGSGLRQYLIRIIHEDYGTHFQVTQVRCPILSTATSSSYEDPACK